MLTAPSPEGSAANPNAFKPTRITHTQQHALAYHHSKQLERAKTAVFMPQATRRPAQHLSRAKGRKLQ
ncbi:hypothetical protein MOKP101_38700 [Mycobacterium avium subsp. hominissuis]